MGDPVLVCDGYFWNSTAPTCRREDIPPPTKCDFEEEDLCGWEQSDNSVGIYGQSWTQTDVPVSDNTKGTGPTESLSGKAMFLESSGALHRDQSSFYNRTAALFSPVYAANYSLNYAFVSLKVSMNGATMGELRIYQVAEGNVRLEDVDPLIKVSGDQGDQWRLIVAKLHPTNEPFQLAIAGSLGSSYLSDLAVDSFRLKYGRDNYRLEKLTADSQISHHVPSNPKSPDSCLNRCGNTTVLSWPEGHCLCDSFCVLGADEHPDCCPDYLLRCHYDNNVVNQDSRLAIMKAYGVTWTDVSIVCGAVLVSVAVCVVSVRVCRSGGRTKTAQSLREAGVDQERLYEESDLRYMVHLEEEDEAERINFELATPDVIYDDPVVLGEEAKKFPKW